MRRTFATGRRSGGRGRCAALQSGRAAGHLANTAGGRRAAPAVGRHPGPPGPGAGPGPQRPARRRGRGLGAGRPLALAGRGRGAPGARGPARAGGRPSDPGALAAPARGPAAFRQPREPYLEQPGRPAGRPRRGLRLRPPLRAPARHPHRGPRPHRPGARAGGPDGRPPGRPAAVRGRAPGAPGDRPLRAALPADGGRADRSPGGAARGGRRGVTRPGANAGGLVLEDDPDQLARLGGAVRTAGLVPLLAEHPRKALAMLDVRRPVLAVVDLDMSKAPQTGRTAQEVLARLYERHGVCTPIVYSVNVGSVEQRDRIAGIHAYALTQDKRDGEDALLERMRRLLRARFGDLVIEGGAIRHLPSGSVFSHRVGVSLVLARRANLEVAL